MLRIAPVPSLVCLALVAGHGFAQPEFDDLPRITLGPNPIRIGASCRLVIPPGTVTHAAADASAIVITKDNVTLVFAPGSVLRGAEDGTPPDTLVGTGIRLEGVNNVTIHNADIRGFHDGIVADRCSNLSLLRGTFSDNFRQHLRSTPWAEDASDWLWPHENDQQEWLRNYGAAVALRSCNAPILRQLTVRRGQNGIILDRVNHARLYDNDCSFLSGWGLAMWRSDDNLITRNAFDFCVRGHSEPQQTADGGRVGYNRGQDSAGILMFEQCNRNILAENSATHGGDGLFGFGGKEAIGDRTPLPADWTTGRGCNDNIIASNDFSDASAHGMEMTFSAGNRFLRNRAARNGICGLWGGYSRDSNITHNTFDSNGQLAYGQERGGVNIEHGSNNRILYNQFVNNACGVRLWWDDDGKLLTLPGVAKDGAPVRNELVAHNSFKITQEVFSLGKPVIPVAIHLSHGGKPANLEVLGVNDNDFESPQHIDKWKVDEGFLLDAMPANRDLVEPAMIDPTIEPLGVSRPVGARERLNGRDQIVMDEWGPWDHESPMARVLRRGGGEHIYEIGGLPPNAVAMHSTAKTSLEQQATGRIWARIAAESDGVFPYTIEVTSDSLKRSWHGTVIRTSWDCSFFSWKSIAGDQTVPTPPADLAAWRALGDGPSAAHARLPDLQFNFGSRGPKDVIAVPALKDADVGRDFFGNIAKASIPLSPGHYQIATTSDDGVRVKVNGATLIERWTHHGPMRDAATFEVAPPEPTKPVEPTVIEIEYFEISGSATLTLDIEPIAANAPH